MKQQRDLLGRTELGDQPGVGRIGLAASPQGGAVGLDAGGIDHADGVAGVAEELGQLLPVRPGCLQAHVKQARLVLGKPGQQLLEAGLAVGNDLAAHLAPRQPQAHVHLQLGHVQAEHRFS